MSLSETGTDGLIDERTLFENGPLRIVGRTWEDHDATPNDADCYSDEDKAAWRRDEWCYVGVEVVVSWQGAEIGDDALWAVEDGKLGEVTCDPFQWTPGEQTRDGEHVVNIGGSQLWEVAGQAVQDAVIWLAGLVGEPAARTALDTAIRWTARTDEPGLGIDERAEYCGFDGITDEEIATVLAGDCEDDVRARFVKEQASRA